MLLPQDYNKIDKNGLFIDVRSPSEYKSETIPGAMNIPIFDDEERKIIGTLYKNEGQHIAVQKGIEFATPKFGRIYKEIYDLKQKHKNVVLFCARGGMRSAVVSNLINSLGTDVVRIRGGYKGYRKAVTEELVDLNEQVEYIVIHGNTGVGKTEILKKLQEDGFGVLDLEGAANHRGSLLGSVGLKKQNSQKMFESLIHEQLVKNVDKKYIFVEAESKRIGNVFVPDYIHKKMKDGIHLFVDGNIEYRVDLILNEYTKEANYKEEMIQAINKMEKYVGKSRAEEFVRMINEDELKELTKILMETYYDPMYMNTANKYDYSSKFDIENVEHGVKSIENWFQTHYNIIDE